MTKSQVQAAAQKSVRARLLSCGVGPVALSEQTGLTRQTIYCLTTCQGAPSIASAWLIADALGLTLDELVGRKHG